MITLRPFCLVDKTNLVRHLNDPEVTRYLSTRIASPYTEEDAHWWVTQGSQSNSDVIRAIIYQGEFVGCISVNRGEYEYCRSGEIGYWLAQEYWRKGIALNAIQQITQWVFAKTDIVRIHAAVFSGNQASMQLLRKAGFEQEAVLKRAIYKNGQVYDHHIFTKLKQDN